MGEKINQLKLISFIKSNQSQINSIQKQFVDLFNKCGKKHNNQAIQLGLTGAIIATILKTTTIPVSEKKKLLENVIKKLK